MGIGDRVRSMVEDWVYNHPIYKELYTHFAISETRAQELKTEVHNLKELNAVLMESLARVEDRPLYRDLHRRISWQRRAIRALEQQRPLLAEKAFRHLLANKLDELPNTTTFIYTLEDVATWLRQDRPSKIGILKKV